MRSYADLPDAMLVLAAPIEPSPRWHVPIALALLPHIAVGIALLSSFAYIAWIHVSAARQRRAATTLSPAGTGDPEERQRLVPDSSTPKPEPSSSIKHERSQALTGRHLVLDVLKIVLATAVVTTSLVRAAFQMDSSLRGRHSGLRCESTITSSAFSACILMTEGFRSSTLD